MNVLFLCLIPGVAFGVWPLIMRTTGFEPLLSLTMLTISNIAFIIPATYFFSEVIPYAPKGAMLGIIAGLINGVGTFFYLKLISSSEEMELSKVIPSITIIIVAISFFGACFFYNEPITFKKIGGIAAAILAVILLN